jgi:chromosome segregation ATPase
MAATMMEEVPALAEEEEVEGSCVGLGNEGHCVTKVTFLLSALQSQLVKWHEERQAAKGRAPVLRTASISAVKSSSPGSATYSSDLSVQGTQTGHARFLERTPDSRFNWAKADGVLNSAMQLVKKLEDNRKETSKLLEKERKKVKEMRAQVDIKAAERLKMLPAIVQKEHEHCLQNLLELKWHVDFEERQLNKIKDDVRTITDRNKELKDTVDNLCQQFSLLQEKTLSQGEEMVGILRNQAEIDERIHLKKMELNKALEQTQQDKSRIDSTRKRMEFMIKEVRDKRERYDDELDKTRQIRDTIIRNITLAKKKAKTANESNIKKEEILKKVTEIKRELVDKVNELKLSRDKLEEELDQCEWWYQDLKERYDTHSEELLNEYQLMNKAMQERSKNMKEMKNDNEMLLQEIEELKEKTISCIQQTEDSIKQIEASKKVLTRVDRQYNVVIVQTEDIRNKHRELTALLKEDTDTFEQIEHQLKSTVQSLKDELNKEYNLRVVTQSKMSSDDEEMQKMIMDHNTRCETLSQSLERKESQVKMKTEHVQELTELLGEVETTEVDLSDKVTKITADIEQMENEFGGKIQELSPKEEALRENASVKMTRLKELKEKVSLLSERIKDTKISHEAVCKMINGTKTDIEQLEKEKIELNDKMNHEIEVEESWKKEFEEIDTFARSAREKFSTYKEVREEYFEQLESDTNTALLKNKSLAEKYVEMRRVHSKAKREYLTAMESQLKCEHKLKDTGEFITMQCKMNASLKANYEYRGWKARYDLTQFRDTLLTTQVEIDNLQRRFNRALDGVKDLITSQRREQLDITRRRNSVGMTRNVSVVQERQEEVMKRTSHIKTVSFMLPPVKS